MAYLDFADASTLVALPPVRRRVPRRDVAAPASARLSALEWSVVALAQRDTLASLREPGRIATALATLFGTRPDNRLADPRLEALRRLSVHAWHDGVAVPQSAIGDFYAAGFTPGHLDLVLASINRNRGQLRRKA